MTARGWSIGMAALAALLAAGAAARAGDPALADALRAVVEANLAAYDREDVEATLATIHSQSPAYPETREALARDFPALDVRPELVGFQLVGHDDEFAVARVQMRTVAESGGEDFTDNTVDGMMIFHQEGGRWKIWSHPVLGVRIHAP